MDPALAKPSHVRDDEPEAMRRRWFAGVAVVAVAGGAAAFGVRHTRSLPACPTSQPQLEAEWNEAKKAEVAAAFRATHLPYAEDAIRGVSSALDAYGARWVEMRGDACEASRLRGEQSTELMGLRTQCLEQHLGTMHALVEQLAVADPKTVERALEAVEALPAMSDCADVAALRAPAPLPIDAAARSKIVGVREDLARAFALQQTSHEAGARELFARAVTVAKGTGYAPIEAEALSAQGGLFLAAREADAAIAALDDSVLAAVAGRHERAEARGWIDLVRAYALAGSWAPAHEAARHARAALERGPDELRTAALLRNEGVTSWREGKLVDAEGALERSRVLFEKLLSPDHPDVASVLLDLAGVLSAQGRTDESVAATRRALEVRERAFGAAHPLAAEARTLLAVQTRAQAGRPDPAGLAAH